MHPPYPLVQIFTGEVPFNGFRASEAMISIMGGKRPVRPEGSVFTDPLWALTQRCWDKEVRNRPEMQEVIKRLKEQSVIAAAGPPTMMIPHEPNVRSTPHKPNADGGRATPYEVDTPQSEPTPPPSRRLPGAGSEFPRFPPLIQN